MTQFFGHFAWILITVLAYEGARSKSSAEERAIDVVVIALLAAVAWGLR